MIYPLTLEKKIGLCYEFYTVVYNLLWDLICRSPVESTKIQGGCSTYCGLHYAFLIGPTLVIGGYRRGFEFVKFRIVYDYSDLKVGVGS